MIEVIKLYARSTASSRFFVYGLVDPRNNELRYVGKSSTGMRRPQRHYVPSYVEKTSRTHKGCWVKSLLELGLRPEIVVLRELPSLEGLYEAEQECIRLALAIGARLTNHTDGGPGTSGHRHTSETRKRIGAAQLGRKRSEEVGRKISASLSGRTISEETRIRMSKASLGRVPYNKGLKVGPDAAKKAWETKRSR